MHRNILVRISESYADTTTHPYGEEESEIVHMNVFSNHSTSFVPNAYKHFKWFMELNEMRVSIRFNGTAVVFWPIQKLEHVKTIDAILENCKRM